MSVLDLPRLVFSGFTDWNPDTVNNSAAIYNEQTAEPLPQPGVPWDQFVDWLLQSNGSTNPAALQPNGSWNVFGDHGVTFMHPSGEGATITGITLATGPVNSDPLIGSGVQLLGLLYSDSPRPAPARLVDVEPYGPFSSQIFYETLAIGTSTVGVTGRGACRMFSRWPNFGRNLGRLPIAGGMGVIWQSAVRNADLRWAGLDQSPALAALRAAAESGANQGIVVQFASYRTLYYQTVTYQGRPIRNGGDLIWAYQNGYRGPNPARSVLVGSIGVWSAGELASAPTQRLLAPDGTVTQSQNVHTMVRLDPQPAAALAGSAAPVSLGPAVAQVDAARSVVRVDFLATFPETGGTLEKANLGTFLLQATANGSTIQVGQPLTPALYSRDAYEAGGGIAEFPFQPSQLAAIVNGTLQLVQQGSTAAPALLESTFLAETDERGSYIDEGETGSITIRVYQKGAPPTTGVQLLAAPYDNNGNLITSPANQIVAFTGATASGILPVIDGAAVLEFQPVQPGCCYVFFFPFTGPTPPQPPAQGFGSPADFFAVIRALPFDNALEQNTPDSQLSFSFIYNQVLATYDLIYPVMSLVRDLHDKNTVTAMAEQLKFAISLDGFQSTLYMPITRELSAGKRKLLQRYVNLLPNNVPPDPPPTT